MKYLDIVDENNVLTSEKKLRSEVHLQGLWHRTVHIYLFKLIGNEIYFLVHLRAKNKDLDPNCWDTRFGGHIKSGESIEDGIKGELTEEIGLDIEQSNLIQGEVYKKDHYPNREFNHSFYSRFDGDISTLKFNDGEVQEIKWMKVSDILESVEKNPNIWSGGKTSLTQVLRVLKMKIRDTESAFKWIINIIQKHKIPFQIKGGLASNLYGAKRELADIDISISEDRFDELLSDVKDFIKYGPEQYLDEEWDIKLMTLKYKYQNIDIAGAFEKKNFDKVNSKWIATPSNFENSVYMDVYGLNVSIIAKEDLIAYKKLILRDVDIFDIEALSK